MPATLSSVPELIRTIRVPAYVILAIATVLPIADYLNGLFPFQLGDPLWRFGATSLIASYAIATTVQLLFIFAVAVAAGDRKVLLLLGVIAAVMAAGLFAGSALYVLDALQTRARTSAGTQTRLEITASVVMLKLLALGAGNALMAVSAFRASRSTRSSSVRSEQTVLGRPSVVTVPRA